MTDFCVCDWLAQISELFLLQKYITNVDNYCTISCQVVRQSSYGKWKILFHIRVLIISDCNGERIAKIGRQKTKMLQMKLAQFFEHTI